MYWRLPRPGPAVDFFADCSIKGSHWSRKVDMDEKNKTRFDLGKRLGRFSVQSNKNMAPTTLVHIVV